MITIVDYGMGNLGSVFNMLKKTGNESIITSDIKHIEKAEKLILPGVGSFDAAMQRIRELKFNEILHYLAIEKQIPILGICLGMQLLMQSSEEGNEQGLGFIEGKVVGFHKHIDKTLKIPHMGWNNVTISNNNELTKNLDIDSRFYFVHSYFVKVENEKNSIFKCEYGLAFDAGVCNNNIFGVQFHPEKSHRFGKKLFENFAKL
jgi:glutamine amidotransferase